MEEQIYVVYETLRQLEVTGKTIVTVFNKIDKLTEGVILRDIQADYQVRISAADGQGLDELKEILEKIVQSSRVYLDQIYSYQEAGIIQKIRQSGTLISEEYEEGRHPCKGLCTGRTVWPAALGRSKEVLLTNIIKHNIWIWKYSIPQILCFILLSAIIKPVATLSPVCRNGFYEGACLFVRRQIRMEAPEAQAIQV